MKKKLLAAAVVLTAVLMLGGCEGLSAKNAKGPETEESCLYITKDGNLQWVSVETYDGGKEEFYVEEQTRINGVNYILVSDSKDDEANAYILKDISTDTDAEAEYVMVEDDTEFDAVSGVFASMLDDEADITY